MGCCCRAGWERFAGWLVPQPYGGNEAGRRPRKAGQGKAVLLLDLDPGQLAAGLCASRPVPYIFEGRRARYPPMLV